jgi:hypothetical protein
MTPFTTSHALPLLRRVPAGLAGATAAAVLAIGALIAPPQAPTPT